MTQDPFVALGGGICVGGGWLPPGSVAPPPSVPPPTVPPPAETSGGTCTTPDPFVALGGGACVNGGWLPPGSAPTPPPAVPETPSVSAPAPSPVLKVARITGVVERVGNTWNLVSTAGTRFRLVQTLPAWAQAPGLTITMRGTTSAVSGADDVTLQATEDPVLTPLIVPAPGEVPPAVDDRMITLRSQADVQNRRSALIQFVWGEDSLPPGRPTVLGDDTSAVPGLENLKRVDTLLMDMEGGRSGYAHHFIPERANNRAVVLHHGHACTFDDDAGGADEGLGMRRTLNALLFNGYAVVAVYMPHHARFSTAKITVDDCLPNAHYGLFGATTVSRGSQMKFFLSPVAMTLNYLQQEYGYADYSMIGLSGGGWTTTVYSAIDPRITTSVQVGGTLPRYLQRTDLPGDTEQVHQPFYDLAGFPDLYVLGAAGAGRRQLQILNRNDGCCFSEHQSNVGSSAAFDAAVRAYERDVRAAVSAIGSGGFRLEIDEAAPGHMISWNSLLNQILPELNGGLQHVAAATPDVVFVRGVNGNLWQFDAGTWRDTGLAMAGTAAVVHGAVHTYDVFYRGPGNRLTHAYPVAGAWYAADLGYTVLSDPAATSKGAGHFAVISIDAAYRPVHVWWDGEVRSEVITSTRAVGRPALVSSGTGTLHVFVRGRFDRALRILQRGPQPSWTEHVLPSTMLDFPGAVVDGTGVVRAYFRGGSGALWEVNDGSGSWVATHITSAAGGRFIQGTPSASLHNGSVVVHGRTVSGVATFRLSDRWIVDDTVAPILGSPVSAGGFAHGLTRSDELWILAAGWTLRGALPH